MSSPDQTPSALWDKVLARLDGEPEPATTAPDAIGAEGVPAWFAALAAVSTITAAPPTHSHGTPTSAAPAPTSAAPGESFNAWLDRRRAERAARGG